MPLDVGYLLRAALVPIILLEFLWPWTWGIYSWLLQRSAGFAPDLGCGVSSHGHCSWPLMWGISSWEFATPVPCSRGKTCCREDATHGHHEMVNTEIRLMEPKMEKLYNSQQKKKRLGADCGSDHELLIAKFRLKLKKVGKTTTIQVWPKSNPLWLYSGSEK